MGREVITAALCWFAIGTFANSIKDNESAQSVSRLYGSLPKAGVYASGAPYGAYSIQVPFITLPQPAASNLAPVKQIYNFQNMNSYLKDSYGNRFVESKQSPQAVPFKPFPQQYVKLHELPAHFAQPLAAPSFTGYRQAAPGPASFGYDSQYKHPSQPIQTAPQAGFSYGYGSQYKLPSQPLPTGPQKQHASFSFPQGAFPYLSTNKSPAPHPVAHAQFPASHGFKPVLGQYYNQLPQFSYGQQPGPLHFSSQITHDQRVVTPIPTAQQQSSSNEAIYANTQSAEYESEDGPVDSPHEETSEEEKPEPPHQTVHHIDKLKQKVPIRETTVTSYHDGVKTRVNLKTKPPLPLLDISLLEPLTFDSPLVPQLQHYLPKISEATYHKLPGLNAHNTGKKRHPVTPKPVTQKAKVFNYDSTKVNPKKFAPKKRPKFPRVEVQNSFYDEIASASTVKPVIVNGSPEITYEINTPGHKETYREQTINYNKETNSEPVHITYGTHKNEEPVHYTYVHSSKEPVHIKEVHYEGKGEGPKHILNKFKSDDSDDKKHQDSEDSRETSDEDHPLRHYHSDHQDDYNINHPHSNHHKHPKKPPQEHNQQNQNHQHEKEYHRNENQSHHHENQNNYHENHKQNHEVPKQSHQQRPEHREEEHQHTPGTGSLNVQDVPSFKPIQYYTKTSTGSFRPVAEYEEEIRIAAPLKVNPAQHVQPQAEHRPQNSPPQQIGHSLASHQPARPHNTQFQQKHNAPTPHVHEKTKSVTIQEKSESFEEEPKKGQDEDEEKDFEQGYKNAAFGFPAYGKSTDIEKDFYNSGMFGLRDHSFDVKNSPFEQYRSQSDDFPKSVRIGYKDLMDKMKDDYYTDLSISKPESLADYYKKKTDYYKLYKNQKPEKKYTFNDASKKLQKTNEKYSAIPYNFYPGQDMKQLFGPYKMAPFVQEIDYSKVMARDSSAYSTQPLRYKSNTFFVEPQFQYGFEPISIPRLLDSELAAMASNDSPESEEPGTRKKFYKEKFYVKKTSTSGEVPAS